MIISYSNIDNNINNINNVDNVNNICIFNVKLKSSIIEF